MSIPKKIHYCWFGGNKKPPIIKKCIRSWKKYCPDYEIIEWNESNFDVHCIPFCEQAYNAKKWAFVSDYARLKVLYDHGGIYMDTDVELVRPIDDLLDLDCFIGFQHEHYVNNGLILGAISGNDFVHENAAIYENMSFVAQEDSKKLVVCQEYTTEILKGYGLAVPDTGHIQVVNGVHVFPSDYFCPYDHRTYQMTRTEHTYAIHHFASSWWDDARKTQYIRIKRNQKVDYFLHTPNRLLIHLLSEKRYSVIKKALKRAK